MLGRVRAQQLESVIEHRLDDAKQFVARLRAAWKREDQRTAANARDAAADTIFRRPAQARDFTARPMKTKREGLAAIRL